MLRSTLELKGYRLEARDGELGTVSDFLFDDRLWVVRYLVADTGKWLPGRLVLIAPQALRQPEWSARKFPVSLTREQIESGPGLEEDEPVSRQHEAALHQHYGWTMYWSGPAAMGAWPAAVARCEMARKRVEEGDSHLRSLREVVGYHIEATDGSIGHVEDVIVEDREWWLTYVVVDTKNWLPGRKVLVSPTWVRDIDWVNQQVAVDVTRDAIRNSPPYDPAAPINRAYEEQLYDYYGRPAYWTGYPAGHR